MDKEVDRYFAEFQWEPDDIEDDGLGCFRGIVNMLIISALIYGPIVVYLLARK